jgi:hypothetical protein
MVVRLGFVPDRQLRSLPSFRPRLWLLGAFGGGAADAEHLGPPSAFRWSFVCVGLVTMTSVAIFAPETNAHHSAIGRS